MGLVLAWIAAGCGAKPSKSEKPLKPQPPKPLVPDQSVRTNSGNSTAYSIDKKTGKREPSWDVQWQTADVDLANGGATQAQMQGVTGKLYRSEKPVCTYRARSGRADHESQQLVLSGDVHVLTPKGKGNVQGELTCDRMVYDGVKKVIRAQGHVRFVGEVGTVGTLSEVWATPDLTVVATPDLFKPR